MKTAAKLQLISESPKEIKDNLYFLSVSLIYINKVYAVLRLDICQEWLKFCIKDENFFVKVLAVQKKAVPLHPLSRNRESRKSSLKDLHRQK